MITRPLWRSRMAPPVVIQTSILDCGPASLSSLLRGIGAPGSYDALRDVCATDVDGTSIDALESIAVSIGTDAEQLVLPAEHILARADIYLPAIAVIQLPDGFPHFVVAWRRTWRHVVLMDPATGLRRVSHRAFHTLLYRHTTDVPATDWREWAGSVAFTSALERRLAALGIGADQRSELLTAAAADPTPHRFATLDAAIRLAETTGKSKSINPERLTWDAASTSPAFSCTPTDAAETVLLHGAVILRASKFDALQADDRLLTQLSAETPTPTQLARQQLRNPVLWATQLLIASSIMAVLGIAKNLVLQPLASGDFTERLQPYQAIVICATVLAGVTGYGIAYLSGRQLETAIRSAWWSLVAQLPDVFIRSRPASDITERGHLLHRVRELPLQMLRSILSLGVIVGGCLTIGVVAPSAIPWVCALLLATLAVPALSFRMITEADFQCRTISGSLARFTYDALLGAEVVQACGAGAALAFEQQRVAHAWRRAQDRLVRLTAIVRAASGVSGGLLAAACVRQAHVGAAATLLVLMFAVLAVDSATIVIEAVRVLAGNRSSLARAAGPLATARVAADGREVGAVEDLGINELTVTIGATTVLDSITAFIPARTKVAVVGSSGSGKSSLIAALLGWLEPSSGSISWGDEPLPAASLRSVTAWAAPDTRLWNDDLAANVSYGASRRAASVGERLEAAEADAFVTALDQRQDKRLGDAGGALSGGEAQRVRFARALGRPEAKLVVFDEPFRGLERSRRTRLLETTLRTWARSTVICVMHDIADAHQFDLVLVMADGCLVESGRPRDLADDATSRFSVLAAAEADGRMLAYRRIDLADPR